MIKKQAHIIFAVLLVTGTVFCAYLGITHRYAAEIAAATPLQLDNDKEPSY